MVPMECRDLPLGEFGVTFQGLGSRTAKVAKPDRVCCSPESRSCKKNSGACCTVLYNYKYVCSSYGTYWILSFCRYDLPSRWSVTSGVGYVLTCARVGVFDS